jgi:hypothetical protein
VVLEPDPEVEPEEPLLLEPLLPIELPLESPLLLVFLMFGRGLAGLVGAA